MVEVWIQHKTRTILVTDVGMPPVICDGDHWEFIDWWGACVFAQQQAKVLGYTVNTHVLDEIRDEYDPMEWDD